jgi:dTDP-4-dehydrorhamnose 3,5-epimerase
MCVDSMRSSALPRIIAPKRYIDSRGWFSETFHQKRLREIGISCRFVKDNQSSSKRAGTLRGLHFQVPPAAQAKLVSVVRGRILDVGAGSSVDGSTPNPGAKMMARCRPSWAIVEVRSRRMWPCEF